MTIIYLPSYSPQLNPVERFFEEIRKASANRIFREGINELETLINKTVIELSLNKKALQKLTGYRWIVEQWGQVGKLFETAIL